MHIGLLLKHEVGKLNARSRGGTELVFLDDIRHLRTRGYIVHAYARFASPSLGVVSLPYLPWLLQLTKNVKAPLRRWQQNIRALCVTLSEILYTAYFTVKTGHLPVIGYSTPLLGLFHRNATVIFHNDHHRFIFPTLCAPLYRNTRYVFCSAYLKREYQKRYPAIFSSRNTLILHNAIDHKRFFPRKKSTTSKNLTFLYAGAWAKEKGMPLLLAAWKRLGNKHAATLLIAASPQTWFEDFPDEQKNFAKRVYTSCRDQKNIRFLGGVSHEDMAQLYRRCDYTVVPSVWPEPFGLVVLESIASGTPVIAFRMGGIPEIASSHNTLLLDPTEAALHRALQQIIRGKKLFTLPVKLTQKNATMLQPYRTDALETFLRTPAANR